MISDLKSMWLMAMFDLPVKSKAERKNYIHFRKLLLREGFISLQLSVYAKFCASRDNAEKYYRAIEANVPPGGYVRLLMVTDKQFGGMISLYGKSAREVEKQPEQLLLF